MMGTFLVDHFPPGGKDIPTWGETSRKQKGTTVCNLPISWIFASLRLLSQKMILAFSNKGGAVNKLTSEAAVLGLAYAELRREPHQELWRPKRKKLQSKVSLSGTEESTKAWLPSDGCSANPKHVLGWQHERPEAGQECACMSLAWLSLLQGWHCVCAIVRFTKTELRELR